MTFVRTSARLLPALLAALATVSTGPAGASAALTEAEVPAVAVLVLRENGMGSAATAQKYIDQLMGRLAQVNDWSAGQGKYHTSRDRALEYVQEAKPHYGFLSLPAFLALEDKLDLELLGSASVEGGGGEQYYLVSKTAADVEGCKGKTLSTNHAGDADFIDKVVFDGAAKLSDFEVVEARRPLQPVKAIARDEAACALIDDSQLAELGRQEGGSEVKPVWFSKSFPAIVVASFPPAKGKPSAAFKRNLSKVCEGEGAKVCKEAGIRSLQPHSGKRAW